MKMKRYASFDEYLADQTARNRTIITSLRRLVKRTVPGLSEAVKWGNGCWVLGSSPVAFVYSRPTYVEFGFFNATTLADPEGLLEGKGAYVRHVKMRSLKDVRRPGIVRLLRAAAKLARSASTDSKLPSSARP